MGSLTLELALWMILAFFTGCIIGCILHSILAAARARALAIAAAEAAPGPHHWTHSSVEVSGTTVRALAGKAAPRMSAPQPAASPPAAALKVAQPPAAPLEKPKATTGKPRPPQGLSTPPDGGGDRLQRISGVGPKIERTLHRLGIYRYDQIAAWTADEVQWVDEHLKFKGRIAREEWITQSRLLAAGDEDAFISMFGTGGLTDKSGKARSGSHTRRR